VSGPIQVFTAVALISRPTAMFRGGAVLTAGIAVIAS